MWLISCRKPQRSSPLLIQSGSKTHRSVCDKAGDAVVANAVDHATRHDQPLAAGGLCGKRGADGLAPPIAARTAPDQIVGLATFSASGMEAARVKTRRSRGFSAADSPAPKRETP